MNWMSGICSVMLNISIKDDGKGIDAERLRKKAIEKGHVTPEMADSLSKAELFDFLFLPGFTTLESVTEVSGRGVGLDVVFSMIQDVSGSVRVDSVPGKGTTFILQLPLTLSVLHTLLVEINGEPYALPLTRIDHVMHPEPEALKVLEDRQYCTLEGENIGIIDAQQVLKLKGDKKYESHLYIAVISDRYTRYGLVVDRFLGEKELVVLPLENRPWENSEYKRRRYS